MTKSSESLEDKKEKNKANQRREGEEKSKSLIKKSDKSSSIDKKRELVNNLNLLDLDEFLELEEISPEEAAEAILEGGEVLDVDSSGNPLLPVKSKRQLPVKRDRDSSNQLSLLHRYFQEIRKYPLLTPEEEFRLAEEYRRTGDPRIAYRLITSNLRLVVKIAMEYQNAVTNLLDLIQEGNIGLMHAVKKFNPHRGIRLSSYAQWWIRAYILKYLVNNIRLVKIGTTQAQRKLFFNLRKEKEKLEALGFAPEPALLAERLDVKEKEVKEMEQRLSKPDLSLDMPVGDDQKQTVGDLLASDKSDAEEKIIEEDLNSQIRKHMEEFSKTLQGREKVIWEKRLTSDEPLSLQELGNIFGVTRERVRQIEKDIINRFKDYLRKEIPDLE